MEAQKIPVNGDMIRGAAHGRWDRMPDFQGLKEPKWSSGWLEGFKKRHRIKKYKQSGESASADISGSEKEIERLREVINSYASDDVYNTDETGLFWLELPDNTLATKAQSGGKKVKNRITILPTASATGHKLDLWIIGHFANPRPFGRNCRNIQGLPFVWKHNKKGWMTAVIFIEYLRWFDAQMAGRKVLLLVDGFSAHKSGIQQLQELADDTGLRNTTVEVLPPNTTSIYQPMDQGIINNLKVHYRKRWLQQMVSQTLEEENPLKTTTILTAIRWVLDAWKNDVSKETIANCWRHSQLFGPCYGPERCPSGFLETAHLQQLAQTLRTAGAIKEVMDIANFINPPEEVVVDSTEELLDHIAETFSEIESPADDEEEQQVAPYITTSAALQAVNLLHQFAVQEGGLDLTALYRVRRRVTEIRLEKAGSGTQSTLDSFLRTDLH